MQIPHTVQCAPVSFRSFGKLMCSLQISAASVIRELLNNRQRLLLIFTPQETGKLIALLLKNRTQDVLSRFDYEATSPPPRKHDLRGAYTYTILALAQMVKSRPSRPMARRDAHATVSYRHSRPSRDIDYSPQHCVNSSLCTYILCGASCFSVGHKSDLTNAKKN